MGRDGRAGQIYDECVPIFIVSVTTMGVILLILVIGQIVPYAVAWYTWLAWIGVTTIAVAIYFIARVRREP